MRSGADGDKCDVSVRVRLKLSLKIPVENLDNVSLVLTTTKQMNKVLEEKAAGLVFNFMKAHRVVLSWATFQRDSCLKSEALF